MLIILTGLLKVVSNKKCHKIMIDHLLELHLAANQSRQVNTSAFADMLGWGISKHIAKQ
jgi:hypothetical protein